MSEKITHEKIVLDLLKKGEMVNCWSVLEYGITRISAVIYNLKQDGYQITSVKRSGRNRYGNNSNWRKKYLDLQKQYKELQDKYTHLQGSFESIGAIMQSGANKNENR